MGKSILIGSDETVVRMHLKTMLIDTGFDEVLECSNGKNAVEKALACFPDMVILDAVMPEIDGITAAFEIRKKLKIPILLMTAACDSNALKQAAENGIAAFLSKPLRKLDLLAALEIAVAHTNEVEKLKEEVEDLKENIENRKIIEKAKGMLMEINHLSEAEAYRAIQKLAMNKQKTLRQVADFIIKEGKSPLP